MICYVKDCFSKLCLAAANLLLRLNLSFPQFHHFLTLFRIHMSCKEFRCFSFTFFSISIVFFFFFCCKKKKKNTNTESQFGSEYFSSPASDGVFSLTFLSFTEAVNYLLHIMYLTQKSTEARVLIPNHYLSLFLMSP